MRIISFLILIFFSCNVSGKEMYIGSTPANPVIRNFLGIPLSDPVDFIRWKLVISGTRYGLHADYGIGKPNTNGFIDKKVKEISGDIVKENTYLRLHNNNKAILLVALNSHLLHFAHDNKIPMAGTGGWAYTISGTGLPAPISIPLNNIVLKDSMVFHGRTPCKDLKEQGLSVSPDCYKLKWSIVLYATNGKPTTYKMRGTAFRISEPRAGKWYFKNGMGWLEISSNERLHFIIPHNNILLFTDAKGNLLQGDEDFGYTLSRK